MIVSEHVDICLIDSTSYLQDRTTKAAIPIKIHFVNEMPISNLKSF